MVVKFSLKTIGGNLDITSIESIPELDDMDILEVEVELEERLAEWVNEFVESSFEIISGENA